MIKWETDQTPVLVFVESEKSLTIAKFIVKKLDGTVKEYLLKVTDKGSIQLM
jgi:hypothetical protein